MAERPHTLRIGELATRSGLTPDALRYYERRGLLETPARSPGGFRLYTPDTLARLRFIQQGQAVGLTLDDIADVLRFNGKRGKRQCERVHALLSSRLAEVEGKLKALHVFRRTLQSHLRACEDAMNTEVNPTCPVVDDLARRANT